MVLLIQGLYHNIVLLLLLVLFPLTSYYFALGYFSFFFFCWYLSYDLKINRECTIPNEKELFNIIYFSLSLANIYSINVLSCLRTN